MSWWSHSAPVLCNSHRPQNSATPPPVLPFFFTLINVMTWYSLFKRNTYNTPALGLLKRYFHDPKARSAIHCAMDFVAKIKPVDNITQPHRVTVWKCLNYDLLGLFPTGSMIKHTTSQLLISLFGYFLSLQVLQLDSASFFSVFWHVQSLETWRLVTSSLVWKSTRTSFNC